MEQIDGLEKAILSEIKDDPLFRLVKSLPGVGPILGMTILVPLIGTSKILHKVA